MKLIIQCSYANENCGHIYQDVSQAVTHGGDVIITFGTEGSVTMSSKEFDEYKNLSILSVIDKLEPNVDVANMQVNDAIVNKTFMSLVDAKYQVCNVAYRLNQSY